MKREKISWKKTIIVNLIVFGCVFGLFYILDLFLIFENLILNIIIKLTIIAILMIIFYRIVLKIKYKDIKQIIGFSLSLSFTGWVFVYFTNLNYSYWLVYLLITLLIATLWIGFRIKIKKETIKIKVLTRRIY